MGYFLRVIAQSLDFQDGDFIQTTTIHTFGREAFVSWSPTLEKPGEGDNWDWLASDTLRVSKQQGMHVDKTIYRDTPVVRRSDGRLLYRWEWSNNTGRLLIHLALPPKFIAEPTSLYPNVPSYAKFNRGRLCLGWLPSSGHESVHAFELIEAGSGERDVENFLPQFELMKRREPEEEVVAHARKLAAIYSARIQKLEEQRAIYGAANVPFHIQYELDEARKALAEQKSILEEHNGYQALD